MNLISLTGIFFCLILPSRSLRDPEGSSLSLSGIACSLGHLIFSVGLNRKCLEQGVLLSFLVTHGGILLPPSNSVSKTGTYVQFSEREVQISHEILF